MNSQWDLLHRILSEKYQTICSIRCASPLIPASLRIISCSLFTKLVKLIVSVHKVKLKFFSPLIGFFPTNASAIFFGDPNLLNGRVQNFSVFQVDCGKNTFVQYLSRSASIIFASPNTYKDIALFYIVNVHFEAAFCRMQLISNQKRPVLIYLIYFERFN